MRKSKIRLAPAQCFLFVFLLLCSFAFGEWKIVKYGGRDYVTVGGMKTFYGFTGETSGEHLWLKRDRYILKARIGTQDLLINNTKFILSYPIIRHGQNVLVSRMDLCKLIDPVIRPSKIHGRQPFSTVIIDPGHGGGDSGAKSVHGYEKDFSLKLAKKLRAELEKRGFKVVMTREGDKDVSKPQRVAFANRYQQAVFISLHFNSSGATSARGIETFALTPPGTASTMERRSNSSIFTGNERDAENIALATAIHASVMNKTKLIDRGIKRARWAVLTGIKHPAVLFEGGFLTNSTESKLIASEAYMDQLATALGGAVSVYRRALGN